MALSRFQGLNVNRVENSTIAWGIARIYPVSAIER